MKLRLTLFFVCLSAFLFTISGSALAEEKTTSGSAVDISAVSAVLIEGSTGDIIYEKDKDKELVPASITKIMTLTLIFEALDNGKLTLETPVSVSEYAASMGGSQVFLEPNETQTVDTMIKCISIASANDAAVAMAEKIAGSEEAFVKKMNEKAVALGMKHTQFKNCTGLDDNIESGHFSSAYDVALMSRELITKHPEISNYSTVWMDTIIHKTKKGETEFGLTNTNKLVRFYDGITGLKTGSTSKAKYCLSASARRNDMDLIAVIMAAPDHKKRFSEAQALLDYGFANCHIYRDTDIAQALKPVPVQGGKEDQVVPVPKSTFSYLLKNEDSSAAPTRKISYFDAQKAPLKKGAPVGSVDYYEKDKKIGSVVLAASKDIPAAGFTDYLLALTKKLFHKS
ncbi:MAG: D-alanyl-D-alanine carboxypeptidase family protein [Eubacterium sp.]